VNGKERKKRTLPQLQRSTRVYRERRYNADRRINLAEYSMCLAAGLVRDITAK